MGHQPVYLAALDDRGAIRGVLPLFHLRSPVFGERLVSMPFLNDGGPLGDEEAGKALLVHARELAARHGGRLELRTRTSLPDSAKEPPKVTVLLDLPTDIEELWNGGFTSNLRRKIRKPQKAGMTSRFGQNQLPAFYSVWSENMRDLGTPVLPVSFFEAVARAFSDLVLIGAVYREDEPVAAGFGLLFRGEFEFTWVSALRKYGNEGANLLLYWDFIRQVAAEGCRVFNFGRSTPGEGTHLFKQQWGGRTVPLPWVISDSGEKDGGPGRLARTASDLWKKVPLPVANRLGPVLARQLPWW
ncbi:MAG: GNAT family N-acetyltransferase [Gemmatimonadota bacterium]|jgi:FemAB-related protein (PEP-CTERM system-associated)|nr:GNAT family N-acetyltransferase [Gemmatimonadota bacterium]